MDGNLGRPRLTLAQLPPPLCSLWWWGSLSSGTDVKSADWASDWITDSPELRTLGKRQRRRQTVLKLCCCIFVFCYFFKWGGFRWKSFKAKMRVFSVLVWFIGIPFKGTFTLKEQWDWTEGMELPILWKSHPLLTKLNCKMAQLQQFSSLWIPKKSQKIINTC